MSKKQSSTSGPPIPDGAIKGTVKRLLADKGFGFLSDDKRVEYFFHRSAVESTGGFEKLQEGDEVTFVVAQAPKGPRAEQVRLV